MTFVSDQFVYYYYHLDLDLDLAVSRQGPGLGHHPEVALCATG